MLSADAESPTLAGLDLPDVDAIKVPHHGSADPGLADVLRRLRPEVAVIEVGENSYGHPHPDTLRTLGQHGPARPAHGPRRDGPAHGQGRAHAARVDGGAASYTRCVAELKPAYLISGDDDAKIDAWRGRVRGRAERELGPGGLEQFDGKADGAAAVAAALVTMTFAEGTRYLLVEPVEGWKADDIAELEPSLAAMPPDTVLVLIARGKAPAKLAKAVEKAGGEVRDYGAPKPRELPRWVVDRAREEGLAMDIETAKHLVQRVGSRQQQLQREVEKLRIALHPGAHASAADVDELASGEATAQVYELADAIVAGDLPAAMALAEQLRAADERPGSLTYRIVNRLRDVHRAAVLLDVGASEQQITGTLGMPPWLAKRIVAQARKSDREVLERALEALARFEFESRGGGDRDLDEDTAFTMTLVTAAGR